MTDFEKFSQYWEQAVNGFAYRIGSETNPVLTHTRVQAIWKEELLEKRFLSTEVKHGSRLFLDELEKERPKVAELVIQRLNASEMPFGVEGVSMAVKACIAALGLTAACADKLDVVTRLSSLAVGGTFTVKTAQEAMQNSRSALKEALETESRKQLLGYKALLEDAE